MTDQPFVNLPPPPAGKTGWPWTVESAQPRPMPDGQPWPRITIVTPSYNQGQFIEETIRSVLLQGYSNLEYLVIDGGSTDDSVEVIRRYAPWLSFWCSERDDGQSDGINKGLARSTGEILGWLNSDDIYQPETFRQVGELFQKHPSKDVISGKCRLAYGDSRDRLLGASPLQRLEDFLKIATNWCKEEVLSQPATFFRRSAFDKTRGLRLNLHYTMDVGLWMDMAAAGCGFLSVDRHWADWRMHPAQKTASGTEAYGELARVAWDRLKENWTQVKNPTAIAEEIFSVVEDLLNFERSNARNLSKSTSYRIGRYFTKYKIW